MARQEVISIIIDKSDYELSVYDDKGWYATYPVVFGNNSLDDKKVAGDKNTPEGSFRITSKRVHDKWDRYLGIDYPTQESWDKFKKRKEKRRDTFISQHWWWYWNTRHLAT